MSALRTLSTLLLVAATTAYGQSDPGADLLDEQARLQQEQRLDQDAPGSQITAERPGPVEEAGCFAIDTIDVTGVTLLGQSEIDAVVDRFAGRCLGQQSIGNLLQTLSAIYADRGFITTRAYVPVQDVADRALQIDVLEGRIEAFVYQVQRPDEDPIAGQPRRIGSAFPTEAGDVLNLRAVEHGLEQMNRPGSTNAGVNLSPGAAPGTSVLTVTEVQDDWLRLTGNAEAGLIEGFGHEELSFSLQADNLLNLNDTWSLSYSGTLDSNALAFNASAPSGWMLYSLYGSYSEEISLLSPVSELFSRTGNLGFQAERMLFRDDRVRLYGYLGLNHYSNERFINGVALTPQRRSSGRIGLRFSRAGEGSALSVNTSFASGLRIFGSDWDRDGIGPLEPRAGFAKLETELDYQRAFDHGGVWRLSLSGQLASSPLFSNEQMTLGGWNSIRGYEGLSVAGENGFSLRNEYFFASRTAADVFASSDLDVLSNISLQASVFLDHGAVETLAAERVTHMTGLGAGITLSYENWSLSLSGASPVSWESGFNEGGLQGVVNVSFRVF